MPKVKRLLLAIEILIFKFENRKREIITKTKERGVKWLIYRVFMECWARSSLLVSWLTNAGLKINYQGSEANDLISKKIASGQPLMISRIGGTEASNMLAYKFGQSKDHILVKYVKTFFAGMPKALYSFSLKDNHWRNDYSFKYLISVSGFFPHDKSLLPKFYKTMLDGLSDVDILAIFHHRYGYEAGLREFFTGSSLVYLNILSADTISFYKKPWSAHLAGKKVLVVHPFSKTISSQYKKRKLLFKNPQVLPKFDLKTIKAVQTLGKNETAGFKNWFEALDHMKNQINSTEFDIAIIGCGAYGLPLASHVKKMGKQAIHIGGATQLLFGILGNRWSNKAYMHDNKMAQQINIEHWVRPSKEERPVDYQLIEESCYW